MKNLFLVMFFGLFASADVIEAEVREVPQATCQQLAHDYAENPGSLKKKRLKQLQFCINQTLRQQEATNPPTMLQGTIIEPLTPSEASSPSAENN